MPARLPRWISCEPSFFGYPLCWSEGAASVAKSAGHNHAAPAVGRSVSPSLRTVVVLSLLSLVPRVTRACDAADHQRALRAEQAHRPGAAIALRTSLLECPRDARSLDNELALAADHEAIGDFARAAELIERAAEHSSDDRVVVAMGRAVEFRIALGELSRAQADARWQLVASRDAAVETAFTVGAALEAGHQWTEASQWYDALARRFPARSQWLVQSRALVGLGRAYEALGDLRGAARSWEAADARWPVAFAALGMVDPRAERRREAERVRAEEREARRRGGSMGVVSPFNVMTESGIDHTNANGNIADDDGRIRLAAFAEAQFRLARRASDACLRRDDLAPAPTTVVEYDRWVEASLTPWLRRRTACVDDLAVRLADVANLHVPHWEVAAVAMLAHLYFGVAQGIRATPHRPGWSQDFEDAYRERNVM